MQKPLLIRLNRNGPNSDKWTLVIGVYQSKLTTAKVKELLAGIEQMDVVRGASHVLSIGAVTLTISAEQLVRIKDYFSMFEID